ncbi:MAG: beta-galactosidase [Clostridia bacterium]|nr:beta-galactosidase [Clostridia bacterium]
MSFLAGDIHYFRIYPGGLRRRLTYMKAFGITVLQTYVPWSLHEPEKGQFCFDGLCDLEGFLKLAQEMGFKVMLRPSPYICSECDFGGLPYWLLKEKMSVRSHDPRYMKHVADYYKVLCPVFVPYLESHGGPIIATCIENEYGSYGNDSEYLAALIDLLRQNGVDGKLYTTDGRFPSHMVYGHIPGIWAGVNYRVESRIALDALREKRPNDPALIGEYWSGRAIHKGEPYAPRNVAEVAEGFREALENGGLMTFYMFAGGTNFGFFSGALFGNTFGTAPAPPKYIPHTTTYEEDALLSEQGLPTEKYFACRKVYFDFLGQPEPPMPCVAYETQTPKIRITEAAPLWDQVDYAKAVDSIEPMTMEELGQGYGYLLYRTEIIGCGEGQELCIPGLHDRADVYLDRRYIGTLMCDRPERVRINLPYGQRATLELLVENMGRIYYGAHLTDRKGIDGGVMLGSIHGVRLFGWKNLPLDISFDTHGFVPCEGPAVLRGHFAATPGKDTFLDMRGMKKGYVRINGFNLGRYWNAGPQYTLYVPGELLREENTVEIFEQYGAEAPFTLPTLTDSILQ